MRKGRQRYKRNPHTKSDPCLFFSLVNKIVLQGVDIFSKMRVTERKLRRRKRAVRRKKRSVRRKKRSVRRKKHDVRRKKRLDDRKKLNSSKSTKKLKQNRKQYTRKQANRPCKSLSPQSCMRKLLSHRNRYI